MMERTVSQRGQVRPTPEHRSRRRRVARNGPLSDRALGSGVAVWIALRRAHEGGVAHVSGQWLDSGRRVPGYVADALDRLASVGLLTLGEVDPQACGVHRITVTDTGSAQYVALCAIHNPSRRAVVRTPLRWASSLPDQRSHLLTKGGSDQMRVLVAVCGRRMPWSVRTSAQPTSRRCLTCEALAARPAPAPWFGTSPDSGRPPVEPLPRLIPLPAAGRTPQHRWGLELVPSLVPRRVHDGE
jgi:hypothetical protein